MLILAIEKPSPISWRKEAAVISRSDPQMVNSQSLLSPLMKAL
jgi:hypothetical protein